jgi:hypothetical protein
MTEEYLSVEDVKRRKTRKGKNILRRQWMLAKLHAGSVDALPASQDWAA